MVKVNFAEQLLWRRGSKNFGDLKLSGSISAEHTPNRRVNVQGAEGVPRVPVRRYLFTVLPCSDSYSSTVQHCLYPSSHAVRKMVLQSVSDIQQYKPFQTPLAILAFPTAAVLEPRSMKSERAQDAQPMETGSLCGTAGEA